MGINSPLNNLVSINSSLVRPILGSAAFDPVTLFAASEFGWLYEPGRTGGAFANANGTGALTADGDPIGYVTDFSGNGFHQLQSTTSYKAPLRIAGGIWSAEVNRGGGSPKFLEAQLGNRVIAAPLTEVYVVRTGSDSWVPTFIVQASNYIDCLFNYPYQANIGIRIAGQLLDHGQNHGIIYQSVHKMLWSYSGVEPGGEERILDGVTTAHTRNQFGNFLTGNMVVRLGGGNIGGSAGQEGHVAFAMHINRLLTAKEKTNLFAYLNKFNGWPG